jgi:uncharacterized protein
MDAFGHILTTEAELAERYREPTSLVQRKVIDHLDDTARAFVGASPFVLLATSDAAGRTDVSPRGGPPGFVKVLDERHFALPDLNGNNLLDSIRNILANGHAGLLFVLPGRDETLRVNGRARVTVDDAVLDLFTDELRRPVTAIGVEVEQAFVHCAKSFRRGRVWDPGSWAELSAPSAAEMFTCHLHLDAPVAATAAGLEAGYARDLEADRPSPR